MATRPRVFIGSSSEGARVAHKLAQRLEEMCATAKVWDEDIFRLTRGTLETLVSEIAQFDFAVLVLTKDDTETSRGETHNVPRDNLVLECGLCLGLLGRFRTFLVVDGSADLKLPSDVAGITTARFDGKRFAENGEADAAVRGAYITICEEVEKLGIRAGRRPTTTGSKVGYRAFADEEDAPEFRRAYRWVGYLAHFVERRLIEAGGEKQLVTVGPVNRFAEIGIDPTEGAWRMEWDQHGIYVNAVTADRKHSLTARYARPEDWPQHNSWKFADEIANDLLAQLADGVRVMSRAG